VNDRLLPARVGLELIDQAAVERGAVDAGAPVDGAASRLDWLLRRHDRGIAGSNTTDDTGGEKWS
jgi:hypothetical protein